MKQLLHTMSTTTICAAFLTLAGLVALSGRQNVGEESPLIGKKAPELSSGEWINSIPAKLSDYEGKVVLLEFWTFGCINCRNTLPAMKELQSKYAGNDFAIVGVHTPEFEAEKDLAAVKKQVGRLGIRYAVVTDNDAETWDRYGQRYWPARYLIDKHGVIRYLFIGEGDDDVLERCVKTLLAER